MANGRCRMHGGKSTGPTSVGGIERARAGNLMHGKYSANAKQESREVAELIRLAKRALREHRHR